MEFSQVISLLTGIAVPVLLAYIAATRGKTSDIDREIESIKSEISQLKIQMASNFVSKSDRMNDIVNLREVEKSSIKAHFRIDGVESHIGLRNSRRQHGHPKDDNEQSY